MDSSSTSSDSRWRLRDQMWPVGQLDMVWLVLPLGLTLLCFGLLPLRSWDYWWHITMGRLVDHFSAVPAANHYLYTMAADAPSYIQPWMSQWMLFWLHDVGGLQLALLVRNIMAAAVFGTVGVAAARRSRSAMRGSIMALAGLALAFGCLGARTHLFVWPLFAALIWVGYQIRGRRRSVAFVAVFPIVAALWANLHGSFLLAPAIALAFAVPAVLDRWWPSAAGADAPSSAGRMGAWFIAVVASALAPMLNPRGAQIYGYVADLMTNAEIQTTVTEWMPTTLSNPPGFGMLFWVTLVAVVALFWRHRHELDLADVCLMGGLGLLAATSARGLLWFGIASPMVCARYLAVEPADASSQPAPSWPARLVNLGLAGAVLMGALIIQPGTIWHRQVTTTYQLFPVRTEPPLAGLVPVDTPVVSTQILQKHPHGLHLFHNQKYAGYLMYHLTEFRPAAIVFVDQRIELPPPRIWRLYEHARQSSAWKGIFDQYDVGAAVVGKRDPPALLGNLRADSQWVLAYENDANALFLRQH